MFTEYSGIKKKKKGFKQTKNNIDWSEYASTLVKSMDASDFRGFKVGRYPVLLPA